MLMLISILLFLVSSGLLVWFFLRNERGSREPRRALFAAAGFGVLAVPIAIWFEMFLPELSGPATSVLTIFIVGMLIGIIEEGAKFVPLALFIKKKAYFNEHTDGVIYFGIAGLMFGLIENMFYLLFYKDSLGGSEMTGIFRLIVLFFFHAAATGIVGYYFAKAKIQHQGILRPVIALLTMAFIHGFYDFLFLYASKAQQTVVQSDGVAVLVAIALVGGLIISALLNTFMFLYYGRAKQWDASIGLAVDPALAGIVAQTPVETPLAVQPPVPTPALAPLAPLALPEAPQPVEPIPPAEHPIR